jgi:RNA polymerase sigma-70 factor (ECF subfamily)
MTRKHYPAWLRRRRRGAADEATMKALAAAFTSTDEVAVRGLLDPDVVLIIDSGGRIPHASEPIEGRAAATAELLGLSTSDTSAAMASINSVPGFTLLRDGQVVGAVTAEMRSGLLSHVWVVCNPDKLRHWNR